MSEKPKAGEWWEDSNGIRRYVCGYRVDGKLVTEMRLTGVMWEHHDTSEWRKLDGCTGWSWQDTPEEMVRVKLQKWVEPNGRGDFKFLRTDNEHGAGGYTRVNEWMEIEVPISKL